MFDFRNPPATLGVVGAIVIATLGLLGPPLAQAADVSASGTQGGGDTAADAAPAPPAGTPSPSDQSGGLETVVVAAKRLNEARSGIETQTGASTYTIDNSAIVAQPGGGNQPLNQVLLQAPDVVQDSFGQIHVRADHNDLQYRLNGIILPEGISVFSQTLSPRLISSVSLITGALPAEYGLRTAGIIDLTTNSGLLSPGGYVSVYGGSFGTFQPSFEYGGRAGNFSYYFAGDYKETDLGIESPDSSRDPLHNYSTQIHGFGYLEYILDQNDRVSLILGNYDNEYQIPNQRGLQPTLGYNVNGQTEFLSDDLNESQHEMAQFAIFAFQHSAGPFDFQTSVSGRYTSLNFEPDPIGDLLYNGIAQYAFKDDTAFAWQTDASYRASDTHTVRAGLYYQHDSAESNTTSQVLELNAAGVQPCTIPPTSPCVPVTIYDNSMATQQIESVYLQDEWRPLAPLTINYGLRWDNYRGYTNGSQTSPRINFVWQVGSGTTVHGGYSRYFTPPPFELVAATTLDQFIGTSALPPGSLKLNDPPIVERANYYDLGVQQKLLEDTLTLGIDSYYEQAQHLIDEGQFGAPIILTPFNYRWGLLGGIEFTGNYSVSNFSTYANLSFQAAHGKGVESAQFNFSPADYAYIAQNYIHLDHEGRVAASGGVSYLWQRTRFSADFVFGTGLRDALILPDGSDIPNGDHTPSYTTVNLGLSHDFQVGGKGPLTARFDVINVFDKVYQIRSGTGIGVFAPQYGMRRGFFGGLAYQF